MKKGLEYIALALAFGVILWLVDSFLDYFLFYYINSTFLEVLILDMPPRSAYTRTIVIMGFLIFGMIAAKMAEADIDAGKKDEKQEP